VQQRVELIALRVVLGVDGDLGWGGGRPGQGQGRRCCSEEEKGGHGRGELRGSGPVEDRD
jgi:hypothetical protein